MGMRRWGEMTRKDERCLYVSLSYYLLYYLLDWFGLGGWGESLWIWLCLCIGFSWSWSTPMTDQRWWCRVAYYFCYCCCCLGGYIKNGTIRLVQLVLVMYGRMVAGAGVGWGYKTFCLSEFLFICLVWYAFFTKCSDLGLFFCSVLFALLFLGLEVKCS